MCQDLRKSDQYSSSRLGRVSSAHSLFRRSHGSGSSRAASGDGKDLPPARSRKLATRNSADGVLHAWQHPRDSAYSTDPSNPEVAALRPRLSTGSLTQQGRTGSGPLAQVSDELLFSSGSSFDPPASLHHHRSSYSPGFRPASEPAIRAAFGHRSRSLPRMLPSHLAGMKGMTDVAKQPSAPLLLAIGDPGASKLVAVPRPRRPKTVGYIPPPFPEDEVDRQATVLRLGLQHWPLNDAQLQILGNLVRRLLHATASVPATALPG